MSNFGAYSVHSLAELEAARSAQRQAMLDEQAVHRVANKKTEFYHHIKNIEIACAELIELVDELNSNDPASRAADLRSLGERLRLVENELIAATDKLAGELGLTAI